MVHSRVLILPNLMRKAPPCFAGFFSAYTHWYKKNPQHNALWLASCSNDSSGLCAHCTPSAVDDAMKRLSRRADGGVELPASAAAFRSAAFGLSGK